MCSSNVVVLGAAGQVGRALCAVLPGAVPVSRAQLDLECASSVSSFSPTPSSTVINLAAFTAVDDAEDPAVRDRVWRVNAQAPGLLARRCRQVGARFIQVSTDYVFSGDAPVGRQNTVGDPTGPINEYGRSKLAGEVAALEYGAQVVRTSWVYSGPDNPGGDFVKTMCSLADRGVDPRVVDDQWGRPTFAGDLARQLATMATVGDKGEPIVHVAGGGAPTTWFEFAREVFRIRGHDPSRVTPVPTSQYPTAARRPLNATLAVQDGVLPAWRDRLERVLG